MSILKEYTHYFMPHIFARGEVIAETDAVEMLIGEMIKLNTAAEQTLFDYCGRKLHM